MEVVAGGRYANRETVKEGKKTVQRVQKVMEEGDIGREGGGGGRGESEFNMNV